MSTVAAPHITEAVNDLNRRLLPAQLNQNSQNNILALFSWLTESNVDVNRATVKQIADTLEAKIKKHLLDNPSPLVWDKEPRALVKHRDQIEAEQHVGGAPYKLVAPF